MSVMYCCEFRSLAASNEDLSPEVGLKREITNSWMSLVVIAIVSFNKIVFSIFPFA